MSSERRNLYRILHVQPEAPPEVIKAAFRALMSTLRMHPDLGGDPVQAARINAAYETLSDPASRRAYDLSLRRPARGAPVVAGGGGRPAAAALSPATWQHDRRCPFCSKAFGGGAPLSRCGGCDAPLMAAPGAAAAGREVLGRRGAGRHTRSGDGWLRRPGVTGEWPITLRDLSLTGLAFRSPVPVPPGTAARVLTPQFDAVVLVVADRAAAAGQRSVHARLLTLQLQRSGAFVSVKA